MNLHRKFLYALTIFCIVFSSCNRFQSDDLVFESEKWKTGNSRLRGRMVWNLLEKRILESKSKTEVIEILGGSDNEEGNIFVYQIDTGWIIGSQNLIVSFDSKDKVERTITVD